MSGACIFHGNFRSVYGDIQTGGFRRGALIGITKPNHPEIFDFL